MSTILDLQNITTTVNAGTNEEKQIRIPCYKDD